MTNKHNQIVCNYTKIILDDGVTIYPGYLRVKGNDITAHYSDDPNNTIPLNKQIGLLRNRHRGDNGEDYVTAKVIKHNTNLPANKIFHFRDINSLDRFQMTYGKK